MSKVSSNRDCPAVGRKISASECGENRHSHYACPASCAHNPFAPANYSQFLELEGELDRKCMERLIEQAPDRAAMEKALQEANHHPSFHALHAFYEWNLFFTRWPDGRTCCQGWEQAGFPGLRNDQRVLLREKMKTRIALLEMHRVLDGEQVEAVDLLNPCAGQMIFRDRGLAGVAVRFASAVAWIYPSLHFWRLSGTAALVPDMARFTPEEIVGEIVRHLGGPDKTGEMPRWLAENFVRFEEALTATSRLRRMKMLAGMDACYGKAVYELQAPFAECRERLDESPDVEFEQLTDSERLEGFAEGRVWLTDQAPSKQMVPPGGRAVLGRVLLGQGHWRLEAFGGERFEKFRRHFEDALKGRVRLTSERLDDIGASLAGKEPAVNKSLAPPRLLDEPQKIVFASSRLPIPPPNLSPEEAEAKLLQAADLAFLDDPIPALNGSTPRQAARDPALRPRLILLLKQRVRAHDERNLRSGRSEDINWMLRELGADEILFEPPPWRPPLPDTQESSPEDDDPAVDVEPNPFLPPAPPLPATPLSLEEAAKRLDAAVDGFATATDAQAALHESGSTLIEDADELTLDLMSEDEFAFSVAFLLRAWFALVPPGHRAPRVPYPTLAASFERHLRHLEQSLKAGSAEALDFSKSCSQPQLMLILTNEILRCGMNGPKKLRPSPAALGAVLALTRSVVDEVDAALRRRSPHPA